MRAQRLSLFFVGLGGLGLSPGSALAQDSPGRPPDPGEGPDRPGGDRLGAAR